MRRGIVAPSAILTNVGTRGLGHDRIEFWRLIRLLSIHLVSIRALALLLIVTLHARGAKFASVWSRLFMRVAGHQLALRKRQVLTFARLYNPGS